MKLLFAGLIALSMVGYSHADGFGSGVGIGIGMALGSRMFSGAQPRQRERVVEHRTVVHEHTVVHEKTTPAPTSTTVIVNNNLPAQPATQQTSMTTVNTKTIAGPSTAVATSAQVTPTVTAPAQKSLADDITVN